MGMITSHIPAEYQLKNALSIASILQRWSVRIAANRYTPKEFLYQSLFYLYIPLLKRVGQQQLRSISAHLQFDRRIFIHKHKKFADPLPALPSPTLACVA